MSGESKPLGPQAGYVELLDHHTNRINEEKKDEQQWNPIRPSASGECARHLAFAYNEYKGNAKYSREIKTPEVHRLLNLGNPIEWHILDQMRDAWKGTKYKIKYKQQVLRIGKLPDGTYLEGSMDFAVFTEKSGALCDAKSKKDKFSSSHKTDWDETTYWLQTDPHVKEFGVNAYWIDDLDAFLRDLNDPFLAMNFYQLNTYFHDEARFIRDSGIDHCAIIQYNKNDSRMREIRFRPSEKIFKKTMDKFSSVVKVVTETKDPMKIKRDFTLGSIKCAFCPFSKECWGKDVEALKEYFKTFPKKKWATKFHELNVDLQEQLKPLFDKYAQLQDFAVSNLLIEQEIVKLLVDSNVTKLKIDDNNVFEIKHLKTGGPKNGPQIVLRKTKE